MFLGDYCSGKHCQERCKYKYDKSSADIRIGDLWGKTYAKDEKLFTPIWYLPFMIEVLVTFAVIQCVVYKYLGNSWVAFVSLLNFRK